MTIDGGGLLTVNFMVMLIKCLQYKFVAQKIKIVLHFTINGRSKIPPSNSK